MDVHEPTVVTTEGRRRLRARLDRAIEECSALAMRMRSEEPQTTDAAVHDELVKEIEWLTAVFDHAVKPHSVPGDPALVELGDEVDVEMPEGRTETYALVHPLEAAVTGHVSVTSPLGQALLGARPGDRVAVDGQDGAYTCILRARRRSL